jgi:hypothetical protein
MTYLCQHCNKEYSSYQSRCNHIRRYHKVTVVVKFPEGEKSSENVVVNLSDNKTCKYCNKKLCDRMYRWKHEKKCKMKNNIKDTITNTFIFEEKIKELEEKHRIEMEQFKNDLLKSLKIDKKELNKINNQLNQQNIQNNNNNNYYFQLGYENFPDKLSDKRKLGILNRQANSVNSFIEMIYQDKDFKPYQNVYITNLRSKTAYKYDDKMNKFIAVNQKELIDHLFETRLNDIQQFYDDLEEDMDPYKSNQMKLFLQRVDNELVYRNIKTC